MSESSTDDNQIDDIQIDFINELKDYIPALRDEVCNIKSQDCESSDVDLTELHRLVHTIRGASALVKLENLSKVAAEFEEVIERVLNKCIGLDLEAANVFDDTIAFFDAYSSQVPFDDAFDPQNRDRIMSALSKLRERASTGCRQDLLTQLLRSADEEKAAFLPSEGDDLLAVDDIDLTSDHLVADEDDPADWTCVEPDESKVDNDKQLLSGVGDNNAANPSDHETGAPEGIDLHQQELMEGFYQEAEDHFLDLGKTLSILESQIEAPVALSSDHKECIRLIRRSVHTIKGAAAVIKLKPIAKWGHEFEDVLDWLYEQAKELTPEHIRLIADAADILERFVATPQSVDAAKIERLRADFIEILGHGSESVKTDGPSTAADGYLSAEKASNGTIRKIKGQPDSASADARTGMPGPGRTLRVDVAKVEALVGLAGEFTIALSAFDQDMDGLGSLISEIDRARLRMDQTARDLELGYELKAIRQLGSSPSMPATPPSANGGASDSPAFSDFDLLELDRYSELNLIIRSLSETAVDVSTISRQLSDIYSGFDAYLNRLRILLSEFHEKSMRMRMTPMSTIVNRMRRTVRETADILGKKVRLVIHGERTELDKLVWEQLADALMHLLRNAVDHGIETPAARQAAGKPEFATVHLNAAYQGNQVVIRVADDGAGLDLAAIREMVASSFPQIDVDAMSKAQLADTIFQPGFSTCRTVSEVSGRGVGLDVVRQNILGLKGTARVETTEAGSGTTFRIKLPLTMAVMQALIFDVGGQRYATALHEIKEIVRVNPKDIQGERNKSVTVGNRRLPFYPLSERLTGAVSETSSRHASQWPLVLIVDTEMWHGAVAIDRMFSHREIVIKNLGTHLRMVKGIAGATIMGDGTVVPILDLEALLGSDTVGRNETGPFGHHAYQKPLEIMVVDDSVSVRAVVSRLMQRQGWRVQTAKDGVEAMERLHTKKPDLIILDVEMPRMNGYEFMSAFRSKPSFAETPVIMLTSRGAKKHRAKAEKLGVTGFMTKPYDDDVFIDLVKQLSRQPTAEDRAKQSQKVDNHVEIGPF